MSADGAVVFQGSRDGNLYAISVDRTCGNSASSTCPAPYASSPGATSCSPCPAGTTSPAGSTSQSDCVSAATTTSCPANHYYDGSACEPCIAGTTAAAHPADNTHPGCKCDGIPRVLTPTELNDGLDCPTACMDGICYRISIF